MDEDPTVADEPDGIYSDERDRPLLPRALGALGRRLRSGKLSRRVGERLGSPRRRLIATVVVVCVVGAGIAIAVSKSGSSSSASGGETVIYSPVEARTLQDTTVLSGTLGHKSITTVNAQSPGYVSAVYAQDNQTAEAGDALFSLNGRNAIAEDGTIPFFRSLGPGDVGADVLELKQILAASGDDPGTMDDVFTQQTQAALAQWQDQHGYPSANPASSEAVTVGLQQGTGYQIGAQSTAGLTIGPPAGQTSTAAPQVPQGPAPSQTTSQASASPTPGTSTGASGSSAGRSQSANERNRPADGMSAARDVDSLPQTRERSGPGVHSRQVAHIGFGPQLSISGSTSVDPGGSATLTITATNAPTSDTDVYLDITGSAEAGVDYTPVNPVVILGTGTTTTTVTIDTLPNQTVGPNKFINVTLEESPTDSYGVTEPSSATITISEPIGTAALPTLTLTSSTTYLTKGEPYPVVIGLSQAITTSLTVNLSYGGTAQNGTDFTPPAGSIVVPPGQTQFEVSIPTVSSNLVEADTTLTVTLAPSSDYVIGSPSSTQVTIHDPNVPEMSIAGGTTVQPGGSATLTITSSQPVVEDTEVALSIAGSAVAGTDYNPPDPVVTIPAGQTSTTISIQTLINQVIAPDRYVVVSIAQSASGSYTVTSPGSAVITILGATTTSSPPIVTLSSAINYLHKGSPFQIAIGLSEAAAIPVTINLTYGGTAVVGTDYTLPPGVIQVPIGQTAFEVTIPTISDNLVEADQTLTVSLAPSPEYQIGDPNTASVDITSDVVPTLTISASTSTLSEGSDATFTITADQAPVKNTSVNFAVAGTAQPGEDYVPLAGTVILPAGQTQVTVTFQSIQKDVVFEPTDMIVGQWPIRIGQVYISQGDTVTTGNPLVDLTQPNVTVTLQADPSDFTKLALGQSCTMTISGGQTELSGTISELDTNPTVVAGSSGGASSQVFEGQIEVSDLNAGQQAADGATVSITVVTQQATNAVSVPIAAVEQNGVGQDIVRVIQLAHPEEIRDVPVTTGLTEGSYVQVTGNVHVGQTVIVTVDSNQS